MITKDFLIHAIANFVELYISRQEDYVNLNKQITKVQGADFNTSIEMIDSKLESFIFDFFNNLVNQINGDKLLIEHIIYDTGIVSVNGKKFNLKNKEELINYLQLDNSASNHKSNPKSKPSHEEEALEILKKLLGID